MGPGANLAAARALVNRYQLALFDIELLFFIHNPFVMTIAAQSIPLMLFFQGGLLEWKYFGHETSMAEMKVAYNPISIASDAGLPSATG